MFVLVHVLILSEDVLPSIHADPEYPCELVGTWNTWYGEQDQAGKSTPSSSLSEHTLTIICLIKDSHTSSNLGLDRHFD